MNRRDLLGSGLAALAAPALADEEKIVTLPENGDSKSAAEELDTTDAAILKWLKSYKDTPPGVVQELQWIEATERMYFLDSDTHKVFRLKGPILIGRRRYPQCSAESTNDYFVTPWVNVDISKAERIYVNSIDVDKLLTE